MSDDIMNPYSGNRDRYAPYQAEDIIYDIERNRGPIPVGQNVSTQVGQRVTMLASETTVQQRLLTVTDPLMGSWVLTLRTGIAGSSSASANINDLLAVLTIGSGGATQECIINVSPDATIQLPCNSLSVDLRWDTALTAGGGFTPVRPDLVVTGIVQRGISSAYAHRYYYMPLGTALTVANNFLVPAFAKKWISWSVSTQWFNVNTQLNILTGTAAGGAIQFYDGVDLEGAAGIGQPFEIPGGAVSFSVVSSLGGFNLNVPTVLDFLVQL